MTRRQFIYVALVCGLEVYFLNQALMDEQYPLALFMGFFLVRALRQVYQLGKFLERSSDFTKKKD